MSHLDARVLPAVRHRYVRRSAAQRGRRGSARRGSARRGTALALGVQVVLSAALTCRPALAQGLELPRDSARTDSVRRDSLLRRHSHGSMLLLPVMAVGVMVVAFAPAPLAWVVKDSAPMAFWEDHRAAYVTAGGYFHKGQTWAHSVHVETLRGGVYTELKVEDFYRPRRLRYLTARGGYLFRPTPTAVAGGVTVGYRYLHRDRRLQGLEIGLPLLIGFPTNRRAGTIRVEPSYVFSPARVISYNYRFQLDHPIAGGPYFAGVAVVWKSYEMYPESPCEGSCSSVVTLLFGTRY